MSSQVQSLEVSYFLQMTEDEEKVLKAVAVLVGDVPPERQEAEGHFGNAIIWVRHHLTGGDAESAFKKIVSRMDGDERRVVLGELPSLLDEHNALYIRLSKQVLVMNGNAVLASSDPIRVKVKPRSFMIKGDPVAFYTRLFEDASH